MINKHYIIIFKLILLFLFILDALIFDRFLTDFESGKNIPLKRFGSLPNLQEILLYS